MPLSVRRHKKRKQIKYRNKKKIRRRQVKMPNVSLPIMSNAWDDNKSVRKNYLEMGLSINANESVGKRKKRKQRKTHICVKMAVCENLEKDAKAPRTKRFKLPTPQVKYLTYLTSKYGDDYKAMAKDSKNVYQETWKKIRHRIQQFKKLKRCQKFLDIKPLSDTMDNICSTNMEM